MTDPNSITAKQLIVYIVSTQIGLGVWTISANLAKSAGHDGWIALVAAGLMMALLSVGIILLLKRYRDQSILEINRHLFGRFAGTALNGIFLLYIIVFAAFEVRGFTEIVRILFMPLTPPLVLSCILLIPTLYLTWHGLNAVCKFSQTIFLFLSLIILLTVSLKGQLQPTFLLPVGAAGFKKIASAAAITTFIYLGPELVVFIYPHILDKRPALKYTVYANFLTTFFYTSVCLISTAFFGETMLANLKISLFNLPSIHPLGIIQRLNFIFTVLWFPFLESALRLFYFTSYHTLNNLLGLKRNGWLFWGLFVFIIAISRIPRDFNQLFDYSNYISYWGIGIIALILIYYPLSFLIKRGTIQQKP